MKNVSKKMKGETMETLACCAAFFIGVIIGLIVCRISTTRKTMGRLRIDHSEPDEPTRMFLELKGVTPDMISRNKFVMFEVVNESYLSRD